MPNTIPGGAITLYGRVVRKVDCLSFVVVDFGGKVFPPSGDFVVCGGGSGDQMSRLADSPQDVSA